MRAEIRYQFTLCRLSFIYLMLKPRSALRDGVMFKMLISYGKVLCGRTCENFREFETIVTLKLNFL